MLFNLSAPADLSRLLEGADLTLLSVDVSLSKEELRGLRRAKERSIGRDEASIGAVLDLNGTFIQFLIKISLKMLK